MTTIKDVAKLAGVSPSTVSRVIADSKSISQATKKKVRQAMADLNYYPNLNARSLVSKESKSIGLVLPTATDAFYQNPFFPTVLRGINEEAAAQGYALQLSTGHAIEDRLDHVKKMVYGKLVDGLVFLYANAQDPIVTYAKTVNFPFVMIGTPNSREINYVDNDNILAGQLASQYLLQAGLDDLTYIGGNKDQRFVIDRLQGFQQAHQDAGIRLQARQIVNDFEPLPGFGYDLGQRLAGPGQSKAYVIADMSFASAFKLGYQAIRGSCPPVITFAPFVSQEFTLPDSDPIYHIRGQDLGKEAAKILFDLLQSDRRSQTYIHKVIPGELVTT